MQADQINCLKLLEIRDIVVVLTSRQAVYVWINSMMNKYIKL